MISPSHFHPMLVHFPIALVVIGFIAEIAFMFYKREACLSKTGFYLLITGTLSALIALLTGVLFTSDMSGSAGDIKETHELFAWITVITLIVASIFRIFLMVKKIERSDLNWVAFFLYGLAAISVSITGFFGGNLVYSYMMPL
jgi:uncharacterized membrane protein